MKRTSHCRVCGKPLSDPVSLEAGVGPVCRVAEKLRVVDGRQQDLFGNERSTYSLTVEGSVICIVDHDKGRTVTNDAERVVEDLVECGHDLAGMRVIYRDTRGVWDEMLVRNGRFHGFAPVGEKDRGAALATLARTASRRPAGSSTVEQFLSAGAGAFEEVAHVVTDMRGNVLSVRAGGRG